jgi:hypothetical protein
MLYPNRGLDTQQGHAAYAQVQALDPRHGGAWGLTSSHKGETMPLPMKDEWSRSEARVERSLRLIEAMIGRVSVVVLPLSKAWTKERLEEIRAILAGEQ